MKYEKYQLESDRKLLIFEFVSVGPKGSLRSKDIKNEWLRFIYLRSWFYWTY